MRMGIIPALAGNIPPFYKNGALTWDHPRACGEHLRKKNVLADSAGSSPRLRGTFCLSILAVNQRGIIPALAGNMWRSFRSSASRRDHPRACGEHRLLLLASTRNWGSSPRLRGTYIQTTHHEPVRGIIPALAGNISSAIVFLSRAWDHPRACGEHNGHIAEPFG